MVQLIFVDISSVHRYTEWAKKTQGTDPKDAEEKFEELKADPNAFKDELGLGVKGKKEVRVMVEVSKGVTTKRVRMDGFNG